MSKPNIDLVIFAIFTWKEIYLQRTLKGFGTRYGPSKYVSLSLILWFVTKNTNFKELSLLSSMILSNYFGDAIHLVPELEGGLKYCKINFKYTSILKY